MISVESLTKQYGHFTAVDNVSFTAATGRVTGFLGPNGAGKSTPMRIMVGLTRPSSGRVTITGRDYRELVNPGLEVGVLLDASAQHAGRTGREILTIAAQTMGLPKSRVTETLARVGLTEIEVIADDLVVIGQGRIVAQGSKSELLAAAGTLVRTVDVDRLARALHEASVVTTPIDGGLRADADP